MARENDLGRALMMPMIDPDAVQSRLQRSEPIPIFTFVNDDDSYAEMRRSFQLAGFGTDRASFIELRTSRSPTERDPYSMISNLIPSRKEPFFILCHQDIRLDQGHTWSNFVSAIETLYRVDAKWAVAGNAGGSSALRLIRRLTDPHGGRTDDSLPARVQTLDENFLVIRTGTGVACSPGLQGFHFYGSDLCLNARAADYRCYVVDFHISHLSSGRRNVEYDSVRHQFVTSWSQHFMARYIRTPTEVLFLSRSKALRSVLGATRIRKILKNHSNLGKLVGAVLARD